MSIRENSRVTTSQGTGFVVEIDHSIPASFLVRLKSGKEVWVFNSDVEEA